MLEPLQLIENRNIPTIMENKKIFFKKRSAVLAFSSSYINRKEFLWEEYYDYVLNIAQRKSPSKSDALDITQKVFLKAYKKRNQLRATEEIVFMGWLKTIVLNEISCYLKDNKKRVIQKTIGKIKEKKGTIFITTDNNKFFKNQTGELIMIKENGESYNYGKGDIKLKTDMLIIETKESHDVPFEEQSVLNNRDDNVKEKAGTITTVVEEIKNERIKETIKLYLFEDMSVMEISKITNTSHTTVSDRINFFKKRVISIFKKRGLSEKI